MQTFELEAVAAAATDGGSAGDTSTAAAPPLTPDQIAAQAAADEAAEREAQLQRLLLRIQHNADFPSLRDSIRSIQSVARSESAHLRTLTEQVLGDVALSNKLLRMINTAFYSSVGGGNIDSLSRAVSLMGFAPVAMLASSLTLFDRLPKGPNGARVRQEFAHALMAAMLANQFCPIRRLEESAYVTALFQNLGTMLAWMHFPAEAQEVEAIVAAGDDAGHDALQLASRKVLGISYDDLAIEVARTWGWPETLQKSLRRLEPADPEAEVAKDDYLRVVCTAANRLAKDLEKIDEAADLERCLDHFGQRYSVPIHLDRADLPESVERARLQWGDLALVLGMVKLQPPKQKTAKPGAKPTEGAAKTSGIAAPRAQSAPRRTPAKRPSDPAVAVALSSALGTLSKQAMSDAPLPDVIRLVMDLLLEALRLQRVVVCMGDPASGDLIGRHAVGDRADTIAAQFRIPMQPPTDLFGLLCSRQADTLISDTTDPIIAKRLPDWFSQRVKAPCFVLLPLALGDRPIGVIYGDRAEPHSLAIDDNELTLLKALRNQLVMAMRLRGLNA